MKRITSILSLVIVLAMAFSMTAFAAANTSEFTITTDVTSVKAGESVIVSVELAGDFTNVAMVQVGVKFDNEKFSTVTSGRAPWGLDSTWYNSTKDGNPENLGYINTPSFGVNPANQANLMFLSNDGYYIDDAGALYGTDKTTTAAKIKFTAKEDVDVIDASCFELVEASCLVSKEDGTQHTVTVNQIESEEVVEKGYKELDADVTTATGEYLDKENNIKTDWQVGTGFKAEFVVPAALNSMKWAATIDNDKMYSKPYDLTGFAGIEVGSSVVLYSAYTNGAWVGNGFEKTDATKTVKDAGIILKDADGVFYASEGAIAE